jgi:hypothetical protein
MRRTILLVVALAGGAVGGTLFGGPALKAAARAQEVLEQNLDASGFMRVHEQGTANVAVANFPATQNVAVTSLPASQNVAITNLPAVQNVALTGRSPFAGGESINAQPIPDGDVSGEHTFVVPVGKRLVIEYVTAQMILPGGQNPFVFFIDADHNGTTFRYRLTAKPVGVPGYFVVEQQVTINADPGSAVRVVASRFPQNTGNGSFVYAVSGPLESF